jgi:hypothetical protein
VVLKSSHIRVSTSSGRRRVTKTLGFERDMVNISLF